METHCNPTSFVKPHINKPEIHSPSTLPTAQRPPLHPPPSYPQSVQSPSGTHVLNPPDAQMNYMIIDMMKKLNSRLLNIENGILKLDCIEQNLTMVKTDIATLKTENAFMINKLNDVETFCQSFSDVIDDYASFKSTHTKSINSLEKNNDSLQNDFQELNNKNEHLNEKLLDLQWRSMRENLICIGIPEDYSLPNSQKHNEEQDILETHQFGYNTLHAKMYSATF